MVQVSSLARRLLDAWTWGDLSAASVQQFAQAALEDGCCMEEIKVLAALGAKGTRLGNIHRDLISQLNTTHLEPAVSTLPMELHVAPMRVATLDLPFLWPHALFSRLFHKYPGAWRERVCGGDVRNIEVFWKALEGTKRYQEHWVQGKADHQSLCVPLSMHGDGIPIAHAGRPAAQTVEVPGLQ